MIKNIKLSALEENYESIMCKLNRTSRNKKVSYFKPMTMGGVAGFEIYITNKDVKAYDECKLMEIKRFYPIPHSKSSNVIAKYLKLCEYSLGFEMIKGLGEDEQEESQDGVYSEQALEVALSELTNGFLYNPEEYNHV